MKTLLKILVSGVAIAILIIDFWGLSLMACFETQNDCGNDLLSQKILAIIK